MRGPLVGVGALVRCGYAVLLMRRRNRLGTDTWSTPGGHLDPGEDPAGCAARELFEEVGLRVDGFAFLALTNDVMEQAHYLTVWMVADVATELPIGPLAGEVAEARWCTWSELPTPLFAPFARLVAGETLPQAASPREAPTR